MLRHCVSRWTRWTEARTKCACRTFFLSKLFVFDHGASFWHPTRRRRCVLADWKCRHSAPYLVLTISFHIISLSYHIKSYREPWVHTIDQNHFSFHMFSSSENPASTWFHGWVSRLHLPRFLLCHRYKRKLWTHLWWCGRKRGGFVCTKWPGWIIVQSIYEQFNWTITFFQLFCCAHFCAPSCAHC